MTCEEIARRAEWNRIMARLKPPTDRVVATPKQRIVNHRAFALLRAPASEATTESPLGKENCVSAFIVSERTMHRAVHALMPPDASEIVLDAFRCL